MMQTKNEMLESRTEAVSRDALVRAALQEITQNYREASPVSYTHLTLPTT